jgi:hypothetical protein
MQEVKMSFETGVAQCDTGEWCWAARGRATSQSSSDPVIRATPRLQPVGSSSDHTRRKERLGASFVSLWMSSSGTLPPITPRYTNSGTACGGHVSGAAAMATGS